MLKTIALLLSVGLGLMIAYVDSRPNWNDTGVTAGVIFLACAAFAACFPKQPWLWALAVGIWIPLWAVIITRNFTAFLALVVALAGAYGGWLIRRMVSQAH